AIVNGVGRLTGLSDQAGSGAYSFDTMGRIKTELRTISGISKTVSYDYYPDGSLSTLHYPSGAAVSYTPWSNSTVPVSTPVSAVDSGNSVNYVTGATYGPDLALTGFVSGHTSAFAGITNSFSYNKRLQPVFMSASTPTQSVFSIGYDFHLNNGNNGNVFAILNNRDHSRDQTFTYDALNRLISAQNAGTDCSQNTVNGKTKFWGNGYTYDAWGNLVAKGNLPGVTLPKCNP